MYTNQNLVSTKTITIIRVSIILIAIFFVSDVLHAQKQITHINQVWIGYFNKTKLNDTIGFLGRSSVEE